MASDLATMTGLVRARRLAIRENLRGLPIDSRYRPTAVVSASSSQYCIMSLPETSALLPAESRLESPSRRRLDAAYSETPIAADWLNRPRAPRSGMVGAMDAFSDTSGCVLAMPSDAGPIT